MCPYNQNYSIIFIGFSLGGRVLHFFYQTSRFILLIIFGFLSLALLFSCSNSESYPADYEQLSKEERIVIRFSHVVGENTPKGLAARRFADIVKERSNGHVEVQVFSNGFLYGDGEEIKALTNGDVQIIAPATSKISTIVPEWSVLDLPYAFENADQLHSYLESSAGEQLIKKLQDKGFHTIAIWENGFKQISNRDFPIHLPDDLSALRVRIMPSDIIHNQFKVHKAIPNMLEFNELYTLLANGTVDAQENTLSNITSKNIHLLQEHLTMSNHGYLGYALLMNDTFWNELPEDVKQIIEEALLEVNEWQWNLARKINVDKLRYLEECNCIDIHYLTEEEEHVWENAFQSVYNYYIDRFGSKYIEALPKFKEENN